MKNMNELEKMTFWDITVNEGAVTNFVLGLTMIILSVMYLFIWIYYVTINKLILRLRRSR